MLVVTVVSLITILPAARMSRGANPLGARRGNVPEEVIGKAM